MRKVPPEFVEIARQITENYAPGNVGLTNHLVDVFLTISTPPPDDKIQARAVEALSRVNVALTQLMKAFQEQFPRTTAGPAGHALCTGCDGWHDTTEGKPLPHESGCLWKTLDDLVRGN